MRKQNRTVRAARRLACERLESRTLLHAGAMISGAVFLDLDGDGVHDSSEAGLPGVVIHLNEAGSASSSTERSTITDNDGRYLFDELLPGTYEISKRQARAMKSVAGVTAGADAVVTDFLGSVELADDQELIGNDFREIGMRPEFVSIAWFFASMPGEQTLLRKSIAAAEALAGDVALAESIRSGGTDVPNEGDNVPIVVDDVFSVDENDVLDVTALMGVLANDRDLDNDPLTVSLVDSADHGAVILNSDGSFTYAPDVDFTGDDSFTYTANDGTHTSNAATVRIAVTSSEVPNTLFGSVTTGQFDDPGLFGARTDLATGAPAITANHVDGDIDYTGYSNPPTYGDHHGSDSLGTDANPGITPRPTGVYTAEQPDEDLIHNLEHGHVWISYNPTLISASDRTALEQLVRDGSTDANGGGVGVILTPRAANDATIALASWAHLEKLNSFDATAIRNFVETNRGKAPEGFLTP